MRTIAGLKRLTDKRTAALAGTLLGDDAYDLLVDYDCDVTKPDGTYLLRYRKNVLPLDRCLPAARVLREAARPSKNRGTAAGLPEPAANEVIVSKNRVKRKLEDGTLSNTAEAKSVNSGIVGYFNSNPRFPYCRLTAFNLNHPERFVEAMPLFQASSALFATLMPDRWAAQERYIRRTSPDFRIHGTVFTTVTVNRNWQTAVHQDAGDLKAGFGVMTALRSGIYEGCYLCFPQWRIAVDMRTRSLLLADVHEWHGNTPFKAQQAGYERLSLVMYYREAMERCGSASEELAKAKAR